MRCTECVNCFTRLSLQKHNSIEGERGDEDGGDEEGTRTGNIGREHREATQWRTQGATQGGTTSPEAGVPLSDGQRQCPRLVVSSWRWQWCLVGCVVSSASTIITSLRLSGRRLCAVSFIFHRLLMPPSTRLPLLQSCCLCLCCFPRCLPLPLRVFVFFFEREGNCLSVRPQCQ